jgi:hypothetical protein
MAPARKRGNPNWGRPILFPPVLPTEFELQVRRLRLTKPMYVRSAELRRWCEQNRNRVYVPEWLLEAWGIVVDIRYGWWAKSAWRSD